MEGPATAKWLLLLLVVAAVLAMCGGKGCAAARDGGGEDRDETERSDGLATAEVPDAETVEADWADTEGAPVEVSDEERRPASPWLLPVSVPLASTAMGELVGGDGLPLEDGTGTGTGPESSASPAVEVAEAATTVGVAAAVVVDSVAAGCCPSSSGGATACCSSATPLSAATAMAGRVDAEAMIVL